jgi:hypothetical protein
MNVSGLGAAVANGDLDQDVFRLGLDEDVEISILIENAGVEQFILGRLSSRFPVRFDDRPIRVLGLRIAKQSNWRFVLQPNLFSVGFVGLVRHGVFSELHRDSQLS